MRIEKVVIENLNSLLGRFEIDLNDRAYAGGLFAIVGPSGAGKTTVLDAICLALYGKTPRIDSISDMHDELMNKGAPDCRAEAVFTASGRRYKSIFVHERAKGAKPFRAVKRELLIQGVDGAWQVAAARIREVDEKIEEICGLDYGRFTRSIMLAQFRFAEFLQAGSNERAAILEQITDMDIYRRISIAVYERTQQQKQRLAETRSQIDLTPMLSEAEEAARREELKQLEAAVASHETLKSAFQACRTAAQRLNDLTRELERYKQAELPLTAEKERCAQALKIAEQAELAQRAKQEALFKIVKEVRELDLSASYKADELKRIGQEMAAADVKINENKQAVLQLFKKYEPNAAGERYKALYESDDVSEELRAKAKAALDAAAAKATAFEKQIDELLARQGEAHWRTRLERLRKALPVAEAAETTETARRQLEEYIKQRSGLLKEQTDYVQPYKEIEAKYEYALLNRRFGDERRKLEDGKPCPLCGALQHPEAGKTRDDDFFDKAKQELDEAQQKRDDIARRLREAELRIGDLDAQLAEKQGFVDQNKALLAALEGPHEADVIVRAIEDAEKRLRDLSALQSGKIAAAESVRELTARFGDVDKDVAMIDNRKCAIAEALQDKAAKEQIKAQTQAQMETLTARRRTLFGDKNADAEEEAARKDMQAAQDAKEQARRHAEQAERALIQNGKDISRTQSDIDALAVSYKTLYEQTTADAANAMNASDDDDVTALFGRFTDEAAALTAQPDAGTLDRVIKAIEAYIDGEKKQKTIVEIILKNNAGDRQKIKLLKTQEKALKQALEKWEKLNALIGSASGDKFSRMAQSITFDALLRFANQSLKRMSGRYILVRDEAGPLKPLELAVIDMDQAGEKRPVSNLSGGESFIVSMALALGLSEMSSGAARIDSLFIDEGFASLDDNYLEAALQTLSALGNREGKLIGVISHVEALKNRIDVQIEVHPHSGGCSVLSGPGVNTIKN